MVLCIWKLKCYFYCKNCICEKRSNSPRINSTLQTASKTHQGHFLGWTFSVLLVDLMLWNVLAICEAVNRWVSCGSRRCHGYWTTAFPLITAEHICALWSMWLKKEKIDTPSLCAYSLDWYINRELFIRTCHFTEVIRGRLFGIFVLFLFCAVCFFFF